MKPQKGTLTLFVFLVAAALAAGGFAWKSYKDLTTARAELLNPDERDALLKRIGTYEQQIKELRDQIAALRGRNRNGGPGDGSDAADNGGPAGADRAARRAGRFGAFQAVLNNPDFQKLQAIQWRAQLDSRYAALFKGLNLTPDQLNQFKDLLVQRQQAVADARAAALEQGLNPRTDPQDFRAAIQTAEASVDSQIQSALGDSGYSQFQQYEQTTPQRNTVSALQQSLSYTSTPLTDDQANQMIQLLAQTAPQRAAGAGGGGGPGGGLFGGGEGGTAPITTQAVTQAQSVLSQPQLQALQQLQQQQEAQRQMQQLMRAANQGANPRGGAPPTAGGGG